MAATSTLAQAALSRKSPINKTGVLTLIGFGIKVRMESGHLEIEDGIGPDRRKFRFPRVGHGLKRLVCIGSDGFVSLAALRWLTDQDVAFSMLERDGKVLAVTGPVFPSDAKLRRSQALAHINGEALRISRELIARKLSAQEQVARDKLLDSTTANAIAKSREKLSHCDNIATIRLIESQAARVYWATWNMLPVNFPKKELRRVPQHWLTFGTRVSQITGSPRLAVNPANAILNYLYAVSESESRLAASALGLDPGLGVLHVDTPARDSLACDLMEPIRPQIDAYVLDWITRQPLSRAWFFEEPDGNCRLTAHLATRLSETAPTWGRILAPMAEWLAHAFWSTIPKPDKPSPSRLTQSNKRQATGIPPIPGAKSAPVPDFICRACGTSVARSRTHCPECERERVRARMVEIAKTGRIAAQAVEPRTRMAATQRKHALERSAWKSSDLPAWLNEQAYRNAIQPRLKNIANPVIMSELGVSVTYAVAIRAGRRRPHPRHWQALAKLAKISAQSCTDVSFNKQRISMLRAEAKVYTGNDRG